MRFRYSDGVGGIGMDCWDFLALFSITVYIFTLPGFGAASRVHEAGRER
jgi:hypothetical protein